MPRGQFDALRLDLTNGERVHVYGRPELWTQKGELRLRALSIERFGLGEHLAALERLKAKLAAEGLFAESRKRPLPRLPRRIGLVTGNDAAAKRDVLTAIQTRFPPAQIVVAETLVQGRRAARHGRSAGGGGGRAEVDVIVLARGGAASRISFLSARSACPGGGRLSSADRDRGQARAGHAALRPRRRPARSTPTAAGPWSSLTSTSWSPA
jgi:exodeoxyribonuclease VII large subunit